ncbi:hypothetical protein RRG08_032549 [Elysia crispata]|uniref:G-protein coupled receptors family 2 profile 1 domain-containing protein n=1 Tax=Elysia crispata TaxID=231223 RepID=A0AAE0ZYV6_9GAST|nr:hypothetical protein RRG08_032549 [Elysia crispata]
MSGPTLPTNSWSAISSDIVKYKPSSGSAIPSGLVKLYQQVVDNIYCPTHFDDWLCWDFTLAGTTATQQCPYKFNDQLRADKEAEKVCLEDGTWYVNPISNKTWTDYSNCATDVSRKNQRRADIDHNTRTEVHAKPGTMRDTGLRVCSHLTKREHVDHDKGTEVHAKPGTVRDTGLRVCSHLTKREHVDHAKGTEVPDKSGTVRDQSVCVTHTVRKGPCWE